MQAGTQQRERDHCNARHKQLKSVASAVCHSGSSLKPAPALQSYDTTCNRRNVALTAHQSHTWCYAAYRFCCKQTRDMPLTLPKQQALCLALDNHHHHMGCHPQEESLRPPTAPLANFSQQTCPLPEVTSPTPKQCYAMLQPGRTALPKPATESPSRWSPTHVLLLTS